MMLRSLAVAALTLAGSGVACAQSVYLYVAPGASVYVTPMPNGPYNNGAPAVYPGPYAPPAPVVAAPAPVYAPTEVAPQVYVAPRPAYTPTPIYDAPPLAYGAAPRIVMQRRVYVDEAPRPPAPVPYVGVGRVRNDSASITVTNPHDRACPGHPRLLATRRTHRLKLEIDPTLSIEVVMGERTAICT